MEALGMVSLALGLGHLYVKVFFMNYSVTCPGNYPQRSDANIIREMVFGRHILVS